MKCLKIENTSNNIFEYNCCTFEIFEFENSHLWTFFDLFLFDFRFLPKMEIAQKLEETEIFPRYLGIFWENIFKYNCCTWEKFGIKNDAFREFLYSASLKKRAKLEFWTKSEKCWRHAPFYFTLKFHLW